MAAKSDPGPKLFRESAARGSPATPGQLKKRFGDYVDARAKGMDEAKARIVIE